MKSLKIFFAMVLMAALAGCVDSEIYETRINFQKVGTPALITLQFENISSTATDSTETKKDFEQLVQDWKSDKYLKDQAKRGFDIKNRELFVRDSKITGRITLTTKNLDGQFHFSVMNGERIMVLDGLAQPGRLETNGKVLKTEKNTLIVWPENAKEIYWKESGRLSEAFRKNQPVVFKLLKDYLASQSNR